MKVDELGSWLDARRRLVEVVMLVVMVMTGVFIYRDYGIAWDEPRSRRNAEVALAYATHRDPFIFTYNDRYYGTAVEIPLYLAEQMAAGDDLGEIYETRHLLGYLMLVAGVAGFYWLARRRFDWKLAMIGEVMLWLSPRIFAHGFFNSKDIGFMVVFILGMLSLSIFEKRRSVSSLLVHGLVSAVLVATRVPGLMMLGLTGLLMGGDLVGEKTKDKVYGLLAVGCWYVIVVMMAVRLIWPILWEFPFYQLTEAVKEMGKFPVNFGVLYGGRVYGATRVPWHYLPVWMMITTPLAYLVMAGVGFIEVAVKIKRLGWRFLSECRFEVMVLAWLLVPSEAVVALSSTVYDGWRQAYFVYPAVILLALAGLEWVWQRTRKQWQGKKLVRVRGWLVAVGGVYLAGVVARMVLLHPNQQVYFNILAGSSEAVASQFDRDYWGVSYKQGLEYVLDQDHDEVVEVWVENSPGIYNSYLMDKDGERLEYVTDVAEADYVLTNYRLSKLEFERLEKVHAVMAGGVEILGVYRPR